MAIIDSRYTINGIIDTAAPVLDNIIKIGDNAGVWVTYDNSLGKWGIVINQAGDIVRSFDDTNIIGSIEVTGVNLDARYSGVRTQFPHIDIRGETDFIAIDVGEEITNPNEPINILNLDYELVNNPVVAQLLSFIELKQSRIGRTIRFRTDWSEIGVAAGDIIGITNQDYGFTDEPFRVITVNEVIDDSGSILLDITAQGYDATVYDEDFEYYEVSNNDGIVTIGAIGVPPTPQISKFEQDANPRLVFEGYAPIGIVEELEFWTSTDGTNFELSASLPPIDGGLFDATEEITFATNIFTAGDVYVKTRGKNSTTTGPFSAVASALFAPRQVPDAITPDVEVQDGLGNLLTVLAITELLSKLDKLLDLGESGTGSIFEKIFDILTGENGGVDVRDPTTVQALNNQTMILATTGLHTTNLLAQTSGAGSVMHTTTFECPITGGYKIDAIIDQNYSGARGGRGNDGGWGEPSDNIVVFFDLFGPDDGYTTAIASAVSGGVGAFSWTDFVLTDTVSLVAGDTYQLKFGYVQQTESNPTGFAGFDISWNVYTIDTLAP